jgi:hypothetical protein
MMSLKNLINNKYHFKRTEYYEESNVGFDFTILGSYGGIC